MDITEGNIKEFLIHNVEAHPGDIAQVTAKRFRVSRQAVNRHLRTLVSEGILLAKGQTRGRSYELVIQPTLFTLPLSSKLQEDKVWLDVAAPALAGIRDNLLNICQYGFTQMVNNAIDHSEGSTLIITVERTAAYIELGVIDDGIGIFNKIRTVLGLDDERHAILELAKGKFTTDPTHHSGEGIFFTSRMFDRYAIRSGHIFFYHTPETQDWLLDDKMTKKGTGIAMKISTASDRTIQEIFDTYVSDDGGYGFTRTHIPVSLVQYGDENLVSRSQAKRLLSRFERFKEVVLDFKGVSIIGQGFADEIFRVFQESHPDTNILWINVNNNVEKMIRRARINETI
jgi:STAS-like domain of unknown function (DUF4325)